MKGHYLMNYKIILHNSKDDVYLIPIAVHPSVKTQLNFVYIICGTRNTKIKHTKFIEWFSIKMKLMKLIKIFKRFQKNEEVLNWSDFFFFFIYSMFSDSLLPSAPISMIIFLL